MSLSLFPTGFRLVRGEDLNAMLVQVNGAIVSSQYEANSATAATTLTVSQISGGYAENVVAMTGTLAGGANATLPTAAALAAAIPGVQIGFSYKLRVINESSAAFAWTVVTNTGWTLNGTMSVAQNTWRDFIVTITGLAGNGGTPAATLQNVGTGTFS